MPQLIILITLKQNLAVHIEIIKHIHNCNVLRYSTIYLRNTVITQFRLSRLVIIKCLCAKHSESVYIISMRPMLFADGSEYLVNLIVLSTLYIADCDILVYTNHITVIIWLLGAVIHILICFIQKL